MLPVSNVNWGIPVTVTTSLNCAVITTSSPILYAPLSEVDETKTTDAGIPSTTIAFVFANEHY